ncbi:MAG: hypothetical protein V7784_06645 [Oceanospirillaceae bacterium]
MSTTVTFLVLYLIPILTVAGTFGTYMLAYGTSGNDLIRFAFIVVIIGLIASCYITVILVSQFLSSEIIYSGVIFSILGCLFEFVAFSFYLVMFKDELMGRF